MSIFGSNEKKVENNTTFIFDTEKDNINQYSRNTRSKLKFIANSTLRRGKENKYITIGKGHP
mgnify:CR=1 FL=1